MRWMSVWLAVAMAGVSGMAGAAGEPRIDPAQELQKQQQEERLQRQLRAPLAEPPAPPATGQSSSRGPCAPVRRIGIEGVSLLPPEAVAVALAPWEGRCLSRDDLNLVLQGVNQLYIRHGYITSRAYLPEQRLQEGVLRLVVIEGRIESLQLNEGSRRGEARRLAAAFPSAPGEILRLQDIEQGLDQLNRAPSAQAVVALEPGDQAGGTRVVIRTVDEQPWRASLTADNSGEAATGRVKLTGSLEADNLLDANDIWQLALSGTEDTRAVSFSPTAGYGYWTFAGSYSLSTYRSDLANGFVLEGESTSALVSAERLLFRNQTEQFSLSAALSDRDSERDIAGVALTPDGLTTARLGARWLHRDAARSWVVQGHYVRGLDWLGATDDPAMPAVFPHHQFHKFELGGQLNILLAVRWSFLSQWQAQYSRRGLVGGEQIVLGGRDSVRGFAASSAYGDHGLSVRNQLGTTCLAAWHPRLQCFAFVDAGVVRALQAPPAQRMVGAGAGLRLDRRHFFAEAQGGLPVHASAAVDKGRGELHLQFGVRY